MTEGELKKRLDVKKLNQSDRKLTDGYILIPMTVYDLLDEAKKEFPKITVVTYEHEENGVKTPKSMEVCSGAEAVEWKKKWFGEQK